MTQVPALRVEGVSLKLGSIFLQMPDLVLCAGRSCAVVGPSGSGKTSLLHLIAGLLSPHQGQIEVNGTRINELGQRQRDRFRGRTLGMVLQQPRLIRSLSALDNLLLAQRLAGRPSNRDEAMSRLSELGLAQRAQHRPAALSQGEAQRVAVARALLGKPALLLADEPTSALDDENAARVLELLQQQARACSAALLIVTHDGRIRGQLDQELDFPKGGACN